MHKWKISGVVLDVDGTLIDSNDAHAQAWVEALEHFNFPVEYDKIRRLIGMGGDNLLPELGLKDDEGLGKEASEYRSKLFLKNYLPNLRPFPGTRDMLQRMRAQGLQLVVATSAKQEEMEALLKLAGAEDLLPERTSSDDAEKSKPEPDIIHAALQRLKLPADQAVMVGDTPYDVEAAGKAGLSTVAFRSGGWSAEGLDQARWIFDGPEDLLKRWEESPFAA